MEKCYHTQLLIYCRKSRHSSEAVLLNTVYSNIFIVQYLISTIYQKETLYRGVHCMLIYCYTPCNTVIYNIYIINRLAVYTHNIQKVYNTFSVTSIVVPPEPPTTTQIYVFSNLLKGHYVTNYYYYYYYYYYCYYCYQ